MLTIERHHEILRLLSEQGRVTVAEIAGRFQVSTATARRDAVLLAETGKAARSHGGLLPPGFFRDGPNRRDRPAAELDSKARIAHRAAELIPHEGSVFVDAGPICLEAGRLLSVRPDLRIFTNSISMLTLAADARATVAGIGGEGQREGCSLVGENARTWLSRLYFDAAIIGVPSLSGVRGTCPSEQREWVTKTEAMRRSAMCVFVADAGNLDPGVTMRLASVRPFAVLVTGEDLSQETRIALTTAKIPLHIV